MPQIEANGLIITLIKDEDGKSVSAPRDTGSEPKDRTEHTDILSFLGQRNVQFRNMGVFVKNERTSFEFQFELTEFTIDQLDTSEGQTTEVRYRGLINGETASFDGVFPEDTPFEATAELGDLLMTFEGRRDSSQPFGDFNATVALETSDLQNLLDALRLQGKAGGTARASATLNRSSGSFNFDDIDLTLNLANGRIATLAGRLNDPRRGPDFDLTFIFDLVGENDPPPPAVFIKDIRPLEVETRLLGQNQSIELDRLSIKTNAFDEVFQDIGPFQLERIVRAPDGRLQLKGLSLTQGPLDAPILVARGNVDDLLNLREYRFVGELDLPASAALLTLAPEDAQAFGRLIGTAELEEVGGKHQRMGHRRYPGASGVRYRR